MSQICIQSASRIISAFLSGCGIRGVSQTGIVKHRLSVTSLPFLATSASDVYDGAWICIKSAAFRFYG